ncbi:MAG: dTDP-4-dehydrorhamnose 3,5-epimerase family protein [Planctomycetes bacterium]|nr:dTDP-4-dehydrorhamnose 3,5-epimerase family protein [Planctomycetota bacterium]
MPVAASSVITGVRIRRLEPHRDARGAFVELHRNQWLPEGGFVQWNYMTSSAAVLRGLHVHRRHSDLLFLLEGRMRLGLKDLRGGSPSASVEETFELDGDEPACVYIPAGVAHGFYFHTAARHLYAVDGYFDPADELGCRWDDPEIGLFRDLNSPALSERDTAAQSLDDLRKQLVQDAP